MTQREHLTTEQLSAHLDKQLTPQEQAFFDAHLQSCERCQHVLAELRGTVALLRAMPQPVLPRSFALPAGVAQEPAPRPQPIPLPVREQRRVPRYALRRSVRAVSTLAAAIAVIFILSGLLAGIPHGGGAAGSAVLAPVTNSSGSAPTHPAASGRNLTQPPQVRTRTPSAIDTQRSTPTQPPATSTPAPTPTSKTSNGTVQPAPTSPPTLPPYLDIGQPAGRLLLGAFLLLLSIAGLIATRRRRQIIW